MRESSMFAINASMKPAPREVLVYTWNQNTDAQLIKTIKLWKSVFNADDDEDWEDDNLVWDHLNHFMASSEVLTLFRPQEKPDSTNGGQDNSKDFPKDSKVEEMKYFDEQPLDFYTNNMQSCIVLG